MDDIPSMVGAAAPEGSVIAIDLQGSQVLPFSWHADVFLTPSPAVEGVRHGKVLHLQCKPATESSGCADWKVEKPASRYVVVESDPGPRAARRPIRLRGTLADAGLRSLVAFVRTSPRPPRPPGWITTGIDGEYPITDIQVGDDGTVTVWLTTGATTGEEGEFRSTRQGWTLVRAVHGIS